MTVPLPMPTRDAKNPRNAPVRVVIEGWGFEQRCERYHSSQYGSYMPPATKPVCATTAWKDILINSSKELYKMLDELPEVFRTVIILIDIYELDYTEVAAALNALIGTVKSWLARARLQMKMKLEDLVCRSFTERFIRDSNPRSRL